MTRTRNATPSGVQIYEADVDAIVFKRVLKELVQDFHAVVDIVTGANSPGSAPIVLTMNHGGTAGRGSLLGIPIVNQPINARIGMSEADAGTYALVAVYLLAAPVKVASGEILLTIEVDAPGAPEMVLEIYDSTGALVTEVRLQEDDAGTHRGWAQLVTTGAKYNFAIRCRYDGGYWTLGGWRVFMYRHLDVAGQLPGQAGATLFPVPAAAAGNALNLGTFHDEYFVDDYAVPGKIVSDLNRSINAVEEALTGGPIAGHDDVTNTDDGDVDPATSRFLVGTRAGTDLAAEPMPEFSLWCEAFGAVGTDGKPVINNLATPTEGLRDWFAPFPRDVAASDGRAAAFYVPDFPSGASSTLAVDILCFSNAGVPTNWEARITVVGVAATAWVFVTRLGATDFYVATITGINFSPDARNGILLQTRNLASAFVFGEMSVVGWHFHFDP